MLHEDQQVGGPLLQLVDAVEVGALVVHRLRGERGRKGEVRRIQTARRRKWNRKER